MRLVIAVSGPIAVGKSMLIGELVTRFNAKKVSTRELIQSLLPVPSERGPLQEAGERLDRDTDGKWVADELLKRAGDFSEDAIVIVDSVRIRQQVAHLRVLFTETVRHIHLTATYDTLVKRFNARKAAGDPAVREFATYDEARDNPTEAEVEKLGEVADFRIETDNLDPAGLASTAAAKLGLG